MRVLEDDTCQPQVPPPRERGTFMYRSMISKISVFLGIIVATSFVFASISFAENEAEVCQLNERAFEALSLSDIKLSFSEHDNGYVIRVTSTNPARKEIIRRMVLELLKEKSLATHEVTNGYGLETR